MQSVQFRQILFLILLLIAFLVIFGILIYTSTLEAAALESSPFLKKKLLHYTEEEITIDKDEILEADIIIESGQISVHGKIYGDIIALDSDVELISEANVYGHVICYNGAIYRDEDAQIAGDIIQLDETNIEMVGGRNLIGYGFQLNQYLSDRVIEENETISGDILVLNHELIVKGKVDGDVINILGMTILKPTAAIDGHVIGYKGKIAVNNEALVTGRVLGLGEKPSLSKINEKQRQEEELRKRIERKYLKRSKDSDVFRFWGDITIEPGEVISGTVVTLRGSIEVKGEVDGDVVAVFGNVELDSAAYVSGDVVSVGGKIYRESDAFVGGDIVQTSISGVKVDDGDQHVSVGVTGISVGPKKDNERESKKKNRQCCWDYDENDETFMFRYNRVEGLFLGLRLLCDQWDDRESLIDVYGHIGYGFAGKQACYQIGAERTFFERIGPIFGIEAHEVTQTQDEWIMPSFENSLAAMLIREDFHDFYREEGYSVYMNYYASNFLKLSAAYHQKEHFNLTKETNWSVFGGDKKFRENPLIDEINFKSVVGEIKLDTRDSQKYPNRGWLLTFTGEFAGPDINKTSEIDFDRFIVDVRRYQPISYGENIDFRLRAGSSRGRLPIQYQFDLGGISTLRGYEFKEFENGNRMILGNIEYRIYGNRSPLNSALGISDLNLILFADAGLLWSVSDSLDASDGFGDLDWDDLKTSLGFAISNDDGNVRISFAKKMDKKDNPFIITFRISRPF